MKAKILRSFKKILKTKITKTTPFNILTLFLAVGILYQMYNQNLIAIAFIGGKPITVSQIVEYYKQEKTGNLLEKIIAEKVLSYAAKKRDIYVSVEEVKSEIDKKEKQAIENGKTLAQLMKEKDQTASQLERDVRTNLIVYKILAEDLEVTEEDIDKFMADNPDLYENLNEEETRERIRELLIDNEIRNNLDTWTKEAQAASIEEK